MKIKTGMFRQGEPKEALWHLQQGPWKRLINPKCHSDESLPEALQQQIHHHLVKYHVQTSGIVTSISISVKKSFSLLSFLSYMFTTLVAWLKPAEEFPDLVKTTFFMSALPQILFWWLFKSSNAALQCLCPWWDCKLISNKEVPKCAS